MLPELFESSALRTPGSTTRVTLPEASVGAGWLVTPRSYLLDRFTPQCERIFLPSRAVGGGEIRFRHGPLTASFNSSGRWQRLKGMFRTHAEREEEGVVIDLRQRGPGNWAHFLTNHLPLAFVLMTRAGMDASRVRLVLPASIGAHIISAAELFDLRIVCTDRDVQGQGIAYEVEPWTGLRAVRRQIVQAPEVRKRLEQGLKSAPTSAHLPRRVFISRRDTRRLRNGDALARHLAAAGFETLFAEDLTVPDQFRLFEQAEVIVAVHGAALAPLLYRSGKTGPARIVELFPPGHVTDVWRVVAAQAGCHWIGVRGHLRPEHLKGAYDLRRPFLRYSLQDFTVDIASVDLALEMLEPSYCLGDIHA